METKPVNSSQEGSRMELFFVIGLLAAWIALQAWILPRFGVST